MQIAIVVGAVVIAYLLGGIPFGLLIARVFGVSDVRTHGSGNIGATNVWRVAGAKAAIWVYVLDIGKGVLAVGIAMLMQQTLLPRDVFLVVVAVAAVMGHVFSPYLSFKGGKGVNTGLGVMLMLLPFEILISVALFVVVVGVSKYISLGSIVGAVALSATVVIEKEFLGRNISTIYLVLTLLLAVLVVVTHRKNIERLLAGTESRFSLSSKGKQAEVGRHG